MAPCTIVEYVAKTSSIFTNIHLPHLPSRPNAFQIENKPKNSLKMSSRILK